jgi:tetrapyrrole methylase family protein/MazG family protein
VKKNDDRKSVPQEKIDRSLDRLFSLSRVLRGEGGCPWDRSQTITSLTPYILEETHELVDAIADGDNERITEELGDLIFLLIFCIEIARENEYFTLRDIVRSTEEKMKRRHPHVFGGGSVQKASDVRKQWEEIKLEERPEQSFLLERLSSTLSPLTASFRIQEKAAAVGFDWPKPDDVIDKMREEIQELQDALSGGDRTAVSSEIGDLLFSLVNLARKLGENPEVCLKQTIAKFRRRFAHIERTLSSRGKSPSSSTLEEMDELWNQAKQEEQK